MLEGKLVDTYLQSMELYFDGNQLVFDGYDIGKTVEDAWGDSDYEYSYTIEPAEVEMLYANLSVC